MHTLKDLKYARLVIKYNLIVIEGTRARNAHNRLPFPPPDSDGLPSSEVDGINAESTGD